MSERRIAVVSAGLSNPSSTRMLADRMLAATARELSARGIEVSADTFELRDYAHDLTNNLLTGFAPPALESALNTVFATSYSGLFKSFVDVLDPDALRGTPVLLGATAGTPRHSLAIDYAIRPLFAYLHADAMSTGVFAASSDWGAAADQVAPLSERIDKAARELADAIARRDPAASRDPFDPAHYLGEGKSFGHLLGGLAGE
ncbi:MAG: NAD(P)H-dependent oxidoreductase [Microbacterium sp.]|uniref:CE1759 family FMN reductase n=1 Tax=Microbacterium sp. TaxID=51671 RepID=UPI002609EBD4|nr:CE1759 family FMN reductase [Microbacterium sp.]MCX6501711.1 NAD(P)H-dependent oxidoreductase [Microbacterium sp.]